MNYISPEIGAFKNDESLIAMTIRDRVPAINIYQWDKTVIVLGRGSKPEVELHLDNCIEDRIPVLRRRGGGCAVVLDPGNVIVSIVLPASGFGKINEYFEAISNWLIDGLSDIGVEGVYREGYSDLVIANRKIAGACMQRKRDFVYYSTSILVDPDVSLMERYIAHPPREPEYRKHRVHNDFVGSLKNLCGTASADELVGRLGDVLDITELDTSGI